MIKPETQPNVLTPDEKAQLRQWASATPAQRLEWLEEMQQIALRSGALKKTDDGLWKALIEIIEEEHMPSKFDVIGVYETFFDEKLSLQSWEKKTQTLRG